FKANTTTTVPEGGTITLAEGLAGLRFLPSQDLNSDTTATFQFNVTGLLGNTTTVDPAAVPSTVNFSVTAINDPPTGPVPTTSIGVAAGATVDVTGVDINDVDSGDQPIQVTLSVASGTLTLASTAGLNFSFNDNDGVGVGDGTNDATMRFRGKLSDVKAA